MLNASQKVYKTTKNKNVMENKMLNPSQKVYKTMKNKMLNAS